MTRGRRPLPTAIHKAKGNPSRKKFRDDEVQPEPLGDLAPPASLSDGARSHWLRLAPVLRDLGVLTELDTIALELLVEALARREEAERHLRKHGLLVRTGSNNNVPVVNPFLSISRHAAKQASQLLAEFGMVPAQRARVTSVKRPALDSQAQRFFGPIGVVPPRSRK